MALPNKSESRGQPNTQLSTIDPAVRIGHVHLKEPELADSTGPEDL
jgi:hypothetical protein